MSIIFNKIYESWPWQPDCLRLYIGLPLILASVLGVVFYTVYGIAVFTVLLIIVPGFMLYYRFAALEKNMARLRGCISARKAGEVADGFLLIGDQASPGIIILRETEMIMIPVTGRRRKIKLDNIISIRQDPFSLCRYCWGKRSFYLQSKSSTTLAFAVSRSIAVKWATGFDNLNHRA